MTLDTFNPELPRFWYPILGASLVPLVVAMVVADRVVGNRMGVVEVVVVVLVRQKEDRANIGNSRGEQVEVRAQTLMNSLSIEKLNWARASYVHENTKNLQPMYRAKSDFARWMISSLQNRRAQKPKRFGK